MIQAQDFKIEKLKFNTMSNEFSPVYIDAQFYFCTDARTSIYKEVKDASGEAPVHWKSLRDQRLPNVSEFVQVGPMSFSDQLEILAFTAVKKTGRKTATPGIYLSRKQDDGNWSEPVAFEWNSADASFSMAHPSFAFEENVLYFSSDQPGGFGQSDIYRSSYENGKWSEPENLGADINTGGREYFPFCAVDGRVFFASDSLPQAKGLDVYSTQLSTTGTWTAPQRLPEPLNSKYNDYGICLDEDGLGGFVSSDRSKGDADIYSFTMDLPNLKGCPDAYRTPFCYLIEETEIEPTDTLPITYEWDFGDGTKAAGMEHEHCYPGFGSYDLAFNIYDTITGIQFAQVSKLHIDITPSGLPLFEAPDTVKMGNELFLVVDRSELNGFEVDQFFWQVDDQKIIGDSIRIPLTKEGVNEISLGALGKSVNGRRQTRCGARKIVVGSEEPEVFVINKDLRGLQRIQATGIFRGLQERELEQIYFVEFLQSDRPVPFNDPFFAQIEDEITERFINVDSLYHYSVGETSDLMTLHEVQSEMLENGYHEAMVLDEGMKDFETETIQKGRYYTDEEKLEMNTFVRSLENIQFEVNSAGITQQSVANLDQVFQLLLLDEGLRLAISAHTDNKGTNDLNKRLSDARAQAVVDYLVAKGIDVARMTAKGYGSSRPIATNDSETGRSLNRRVEFTLLFEN